MNSPVRCLKLGGMNALLGAQGVSYVFWVQFSKDQNNMRNSSLHLNQELKNLKNKISSDLKKKDLG